MIMRTLLDTLGCLVPLVANMSTKIKYVQVEQLDNKEGNGSPCLRRDPKIQYSNMQYSDLLKSAVTIAVNSFW